MDQIEGMRQAFREVRRARMADGDWSRADADEASESIAEAIRSGDQTRIDDAEAWIASMLRNVRAIAAVSAGVNKRIRAQIAADKAARETA